MGALLRAEWAIYGPISRDAKHIHPVVLLTKDSTCTQRIFNYSTKLMTITNVYNANICLGDHPEPMIEVKLR
jgi:hypothetical protein